MTSIYLTYAALALAIAGALLIGGRALRTGFAALALCVAVVLVGTTIGRAKPLWTETLCDTTVATVLGSQLRESDGTIFLWLQPEGCEPTAYRLPWSKDLAQQIQDAMDRAANGEGNGRLLFEPSWDDREPKVYPAPQQAMPPKPQPEAPIVVPGEDA